MPYLIDGHNLIPKVPGLYLGSNDDEMQLVELLQEFCRLSRKRVEVYFDQAPPGQSGKRALGMVIAHFVRSGRTADQAISQRLRKMGRSARNWSVVSSDHHVQLSARQTGAQALTSEAFAGQMLATLSQARSARSEKIEGSLSPEEVEEWLALFKSRRRNSP
jgi:uncharacterized protein